MCGRARFLYKTVAEMERRVSMIGAWEATIAAHLQRAERRRQALLTEAFAGRLVP